MSGAINSIGPKSGGVDELQSLVGDIGKYILEGVSDDKKDVGPQGPQMTGKSDLSISDIAHRSLGGKGNIVDTTA